MYSALLSKLAFTEAVVCFTLYHQGLRNFIQYRPRIIFFTIPMGISIFLIMLICTNQRRKYPAKHIFLALILLSGTLAAVCDSASYEFTEKVKK